MPERYHYEVRFARGRAIKYISHLDMMRAWERMLRRAGMPLAHSEGFNPRPKLSFAAPLAVGVLARDELAEFTLVEPVPAEDVQARLGLQAVPGLDIHRVEPVVAGRQALQARMREALYEAVVPGAEAEALGPAVERLLAAPAVPVMRERQGRRVETDLRPLILALSLSPGPPPVLHMRLRHDPRQAGRPGEVLQALGLDPLAAEVTRVGVVLGPA